MRASAFTGSTARAPRRGFTLVELMVALTGGLFVSVFVFMLASHGSKFYQQEARISNATIGVMNGFQRLRADIARAGFMASPNVQKDPRICSARTAAQGWTAPMREMAGVRLLIGGSADAHASEALAAFWSDNDLTPDQLIIAGSFASADQYPAAEVTRLNPASNIWTVYLQPNSPAMARLGYRTDSSQNDQTRLDLLASIFNPDGVQRLLRIVDKKGSHHYGIIGSVGLAALNGQTAPFVQLTNAVTLVEETGATTCGLQGLNVGATVNVVNFIRYGLERLDDEPNATYNPIYADEVAGTYEETRAELAREELDVTGNPIAGTKELVAEYAVDLKFGVTALDPTGNGSLMRVNAGADNDALLQWAGDPTTGVAAVPNRGPHLIRTVHARLAVRSREGDRDANIDGDAAGIPAGIYRVGLGENGGAPFARVRTLQADIALRNHARARWQ